MIFTRIATVHEVTKVTKETNKHWNALKKNVLSVAVSSPHPEDS